MEIINKSNKNMVKNDKKRPKEHFEDPVPHYFLLFLQNILKCLVHPNIGKFQYF